ncbi:MAG: sigma-54-dependent Fis family transcriptional regulator [Owenweeksia sp.]|nr:sigma-54-dependent Fis family transcriptional regulator [Owenweeksia sp.]
MSTPSGKILIIDDEEKLRKLLFRIISLEGYDVDQAEDLASGRKALKKKDYHLVLCDVKLPDGNGVDFVEEFKKEYPIIEIVLLTAYGTIQDGVRAMKSGAFDYLTKGDDNDKIIPLVEKAIEKAKQSQKLHRLLKKESDKHSFDNIIGESLAIEQAIKLSKQVAPTDATVLLIGETGTGKEVFANAIHQNSPRSSENFVAVNCSAFSNDLLESEIFGHKAGSFTGATKDKKGLFEEADGGTIFLDEIGEMNIDLQAKLLRVLENGTFLKVGDSKETKVNVRVIAATNRNLEERSSEGDFRLDLYYRLSTFTISLPSLNDRHDDIIILAQSFIDYFSVKMGRSQPEMSEGFKDALMSHQWKGNVRELRNVVERALIITPDGEELKANSLPFKGGAQVASMSGSFLLSDMERMLITRVMNHTNGNKTEAAKLMGIGLTTLYRKMEEYNLN